MSNKSLEISKPCNEQWKNMKPNDSGSFCELCSKNVVDLTKLSQNEISIIVKKSKGNLCGRVSEEQLEEPLLDLNTRKQFALPFSNIAAGLFIATSLTLSETAQAQKPKAQTETVQESRSTSNLKSIQPTTAQNTPTVSTTNFKGKVTNNEGKPIENAKITFVCLTNIITTYSSANGSYSIRIPSSLIDNDNVVRITYFEVDKKADKTASHGYKKSDLILTKEEISTNYIIKAKPFLMMLGGIRAISNNRKPIVISNGLEIKYKDFLKAQQGQKSSCSLENKDHMFFSSNTAIAIYGEKAKDGLYILTSKTN